MRSWLVPLVALAACSAPPGPTQGRTLTTTLPASGVERVVITVGVGGVELAGTDADTIHTEVVLTPRRGGLFSSMRSAEREVSSAVLRSEAGDGQLLLAVDSDTGDRRFEEHWTVRLPQRVALELELGVGDLTARGLRGGVDLELGVGDAVFDEVAGDIAIAVGVGDVAVTGEAAAFGPVGVAEGVGGGGLKVRGDWISDAATIGQSASWTGDGPGRLEVSVGVGDAEVTLE